MTTASKAKVGKLCLWAGKYAFSLFPEYVRKPISPLRFLRLTNHPYRGDLSEKGLNTLIAGRAETEAVIIASRAQIEEHQEKRGHL